MKMKEDICSIPVNEVFEKSDGCPVCRMYETLEEHMLEFIMGDAMMEPDVRIETNKTGFCHRHLTAMLGRKNRLALALMLETRLKSVEETVFSKDGLIKKGRIEKASNAMGDCYICRRVEKAMDALMVTFFRLWKKENDFRSSVAAQPGFCLPHYRLLLLKGREALDKRSFAEFEPVVSAVMLRGLSALEEDVTGFTKMFDYRNNGAEWGNKKDAPERAVSFLTGLKKS